MVLQQNSEVNFWGKANPSEKVTITPSWGSKSITVIADNFGKWQLKIKTNKASFDKQSIIIEGDNRIVINNVLLGEVWFSSGQSNMELPLKRVTNAEKEISEAVYPYIRIFNVKKQKSNQPETDIPAGSLWLECTPESVKEFSAMSYYFCRNYVL